MDDPDFKLVLPFRWVPDNVHDALDGDLNLKAGPILVGQVFWLNLDLNKTWEARGYNICNHRSSSHPTREAAQKALIDAVKTLATEE